MTRHRRLIILAMVLGLLTLHIPLALAFSADDFNKYTVARLDDETNNQPRLGGFVTTDNTWHSCYRTGTGIVRAVKTSDGGLSQTNTTIVSDNAGSDLQPCTMDSWNDGQDLVMAFVDEVTEFEERVSIAISDDAGSSWTVTRDILSCDGARRCTTPFIATFSSTNWNILFRAENGTGGFDVNLTTSTDGGSTWSGETVAELQGGSIDVHYLDEDHWYIAECLGACAVSRTDDGGTTWTKGNNTFDSGVDDMALWAESTEVIWTITFDGTFSDGIRVHRSPDAGDSWNQRLHRENRDGDVDVITPTDTNLTYIVYGEANNDNDFHVEQSTDDGATWTRIEIDVNYATAGDGLQSFPILSEGDEEKILIYASSRVSGGAPSDSIIEAWSQKIPGQPQIVDQLALFGNAQSVVVDPLTDPDVYVRDIESGADRIYRIQPEPVLEELNGPNVCNDIIDEDDAPWYTWMFTVGALANTWDALFSEPTTFQPAQSTFGMASTRNASLPVAHTCALDPADFNADVQMAKLARTPKLEFTDRWYPYDKGFFIQGSFFTFDKHAVGDSTGSDARGRWIMTTDRDKGFPNFYANLTDVAVDKDITPDGGRLWCATNTTGVQCRNANNGTIIDQDLGHSGIVNVELFDGNYYINDGGILRHYTRDGSTLVEQNSVTLSGGGTPVVMKLSKDGEYLHTGHDDGSYRMIDLDTFEELFATSISTERIRDVEGDSANNYAYLVDSTTLYKVEIFNFTASLDPVTGEEVTGNLGEENPETNTAHPDDPDPKALDGDDTTTEQGKIAGLASSLNIPTFAMKLIFASTILFFGGVAGTVFMGAKRGPWIGAGAGFLLGVGFQLYDTWVLVTLVIIAAAVIAREGF